MPFAGELPCPWGLLPETIDIDVSAVVSKRSTPFLLVDPPSEGERRCGLWSAQDRYLYLSLTSTVNWIPLCLDQK